MNNAKCLLVFPELFGEKMSEWKQRILDEEAVKFKYSKEYYDECVKKIQAIKEEENQ